MNQISHRALIDLMSYGIEELSSADANRLMKIVAECPECEGEWVLLEKTISTLSKAGELPVAESKSREMWLVCLGHAKTHHIHPNGNGASQKHGA